jgi:hypothetical protein
MQTHRHLRQVPITHYHDFGAAQDPAHKAADAALGRLPGIVDGNGRVTLKVLLEADADHEPCVVEILVVAYLPDGPEALPVPHGLARVLLHHYGDEWACDAAQVIDYEEGDRR